MKPEIVSLENQDWIKIVSCSLTHLPYHNGVHIRQCRSPPVLHQDQALLALPFGPKFEKIKTKIKFSIQGNLGLNLL